MDLGLERAGFTVAWQVEIDPWCREQLHRHWPEVPKRGAVEFCSADNLACVDLIAGGFPCQPVSVAGKKQRRDDARWLWPQMARLVRALRPRYVLVENVEGLRSGGLDDVLRDLAACGFDAEWSLLGTCTLGAPHPRERLFIVAYPNGLHGEAGLGPLIQRAAAVVRGHDHARAWGSPPPWVETAPPARRVAHGFSARLAGRRRRRAVAAYGNSVCPLVVEAIGRAILEVDQHGGFDVEAA